MLTFDTIPQNRQSSGVLAFLMEALNQDSKLETAVGLPVIAATAEHEPIGRGAEKLEVYLPQLPALCYIVKGSTPESSACYDGWLDDVELVLVRSIPRAMMDDDAVVKGEAVARRWLMIVVERIAYWLQQQTIPSSEDVGGDEDRLEACGVQSVEIKRVTYSTQGSWSVARIAAEVCRALPPWLPTLSDKSESGWPLLSATGDVVAETETGTIDVNLEVDLDP